MLPRNAARTPAFSQLDIGLHKAIGLGWESTKLDLRAEAFNLLNQVNYQALDSTMTDAATELFPAAAITRQGSCNLLSSFFSSRTEAEPSPSDSTSSIDSFHFH